MNGKSEAQSSLSLPPRQGQHLGEHRQNRRYPTPLELRESFSPIPGLVVRPAPDMAVQNRLTFEVTMEWGLAEHLAEALTFIVPIAQAALERKRRRDEEERHRFRREELRNTVWKAAGFVWRAQRRHTGHESGKEDICLAASLRYDVDTDRLREVVRIYGQRVRSRLMRMRRANLPAREDRAAALRAQGLTRLQIATEMKTTVQTVDRYLKSHRRRMALDPGTRLLEDVRRRPR